MLIKSRHFTWAYHILLHKISHTSCVLFFFWFPHASSREHTFCFFEVRLFVALLLQHLEDIRSVVCVAVFVPRVFFCWSLLPSYLDMKVRKKDFIFIETNTWCVPIVSKLKNYLQREKWKKIFIFFKIVLIKKLKKKKKIHSTHSNLQTMQHNSHERVLNTAQISWIRASTWNLI